jgi:hypothetical protein
MPVFAYPLVITAAPTKVHPHVAAIGPTNARKRLNERRNESLPRGIVFIEQHEHTDAPDAAALLRPRHHRPRRSAPEPRDELPPPHP